MPHTPGATTAAAAGDGPGDPPPLGLWRGGARGRALCATGHAAPDERMAAGARAQACQLWERRGEPLRVLQGTPGVVISTLKKGSNPMWREKG
eukprot:357959-Chlamydomonas_euryale.AAC.2